MKVSDIKKRIVSLPAIVTSFFNRLLARLFRSRLVANSPMRFKLLIFFVLISIVPLLILGTISFVTSQNVVVSTTRQYSLAQLATTADNLRVRIDKYEAISYQLLTNATLAAVLDGLNQTTDPIATLNARITLSNSLNAFAFNDQSILATAFRPDKVKNTLVITGTTSPDHCSTVFEAKSAEIKSAEGRAVWGGVASSSAAPKNLDAIAMLREIRSTQTGDSLGQFLIMLDEKSVSNWINNGIGKSDIKKGKGSYTYLLDKDYNIISSPFHDELGKRITDPIRAFGDLLSLNISNKTITTNAHGKNAVLSAKPIANADIMLVNVATTAALFGAARMSIGLAILFVGLLTALMATLVSINFAHGIADPMSKMVEAMKLATAGDLSVKVEAVGGDELGTLGLHFNRMLGAFIALVGRVKESVEIVGNRSMDMEQSADHTSRSAESVALAMREIAGGMTEQTADVETASALMSNLSEQVLQTIKSTAEMAGIMQYAKDISLGSGATIQILTEKSKLTDQLAAVFINDIDEFNKGAGEIRQITEIIVEIADQTNLIALNAAIEAARAGEAGRGFGVVAQETTRLALRSQIAAETINKILHSIQSRAKESTESASQVHQIITDQIEAVRNTQTAFEQILSVTTEVASKLEEVDANIKQIDYCKNEARQAIESISSVAEETAAASQEVSSSAEEQSVLSNQVKKLAVELHNLSDELAKVVSVFQLKK